MIKCLLYLTIIFGLSQAETFQDTLETSLLKTGLKQFIETGVKPFYLDEILSNHELKFSYHGRPSLKNLSAQATCELCDILMKSIVNLSEKHVPEAVIELMITKICTSMHIEEKRVCKGVIKPFGAILDYIIKHNNGPNTTAEKLCTLFLGNNCHDQFEYFNWSILIPEIPFPIPSKKVHNHVSKNLRILHLTDVHYDPNYTVGAKALCDEPICCQNDQELPENGDAICGEWGDYEKSDTPLKTVLETLRHTKTQDIDYVYFTGDIISHRVWSTSEEGNSKTEREFMDLVRDSFDVPVFFVLGNHEPHPLNSYAPLNVTDEKLTSDWIFEQLESEVKSIVPREELEHIRNGGYYTVLLKPGFRIIVLNNNVCFTLNLWLAYEDYDPYDQLKWLVKVLEQAEKDGEYVHILHHIPSGEAECLGAWGREYSRVINRFADTIKGQFNGHTHFDEYFLYYNESEPTQAINVAHNGASLCTYTNNNPSYKIYEVDSKNFEIVDVEEWTFNLTAANLKPDKPTVDWYKLYSFKEAYGLTSMKPEELGNLVVQMAKNETLFQVYNRYRYRMGNGIDKDCNDDCQKVILCRIVTSHLADTEHCDEIKRIYDGSRH